MDETTANDNDPTEMTDEDKRRDQLLAAPGAVESDADPRIEVSEHNGNTRIDIAPDASVRPGDPTKDPDEDGSLEGPDVERSTGGGGEGSGGTAKPGGLGQDGTIPADPSGVAAGHTGEISNFNPEEDEAAPA
ncbi:MAG: hypothetical protein ABWZ16_09735 [Microbacterium sp.]